MSRLIIKIFIAFLMMVATKSCWSQNKRQEEPIKKTDLKMGELSNKDFTKVVWRYKGIWMSDGAKPFLSEAEKSYTLSFKGAELWINEEKVANFYLAKNNLMVCENFKPGFSKEGFYVLMQKAYFRYDLPSKDAELRLNPVDENGILFCDEGCELIFEKVAL